MRVVVMDYDTDGAEREALSTDAVGNHFIETIFGDSAEEGGA
jgi:hypothetical protein